MECTSTKCNTRAIILAAGKATRFKTKKTKLLFNICGRSMILYPLKELEKLHIPTTMILGYQADDVKQEVESANLNMDIKYTLQKEQRGTGHAVACSQDTWDEENILIMNGDVPLITKEVLQNLLLEHKANNATITFCTTMVINPEGYGRVIEEGGKFRIIEEKNCSDDQKSINRINSGIYVVSKEFLKNNIDKLKKNPITEEVYIVDLIELACDQGLPVEAHPVLFDNARGVNTLQELWNVEQIKRSQFIKHWMLEGVRFELAQSIHIDINVKIGAGSFIGTGVHLLGNTTIGEECCVGAYSIIENTTLGDNCNILYHSIMQDSTIGKKTQIGPFARIRQNAVLGNDVTIGNFVEIKATTIGNNSKTKHLTYLGDANVGNNVNIGAGTILCNYDGVNKHTTTIEDNVFIGSNNTLIAPVKIGTGAYTAGGSTIDQDVPAKSLAIGRTKQTNKDNYANKLLAQINIKQKACMQKEKDEQKENKKTPLNFKGAVKTNTETNNL